MNRTSVLGLALVGTVGLAAASAAVPAEPPRTAPAGIAAAYPNDAGIGRDPRVLFADNFDAWAADTAKPPPGTWNAVRGGDDPGQRRTLVVAGTVAVGGAAVPGKNVLRLACHHGGPNSAGLRKHLGNYGSPREGKGPGYDEVYVRYYQRLDPGYAPERNHGANLGGRDLSHPDAWYVGRANTRDVAAHGYFYSGLQPYPGGRDGPLSWGFYSYHLDKPTPWGDDYRPRSGERAPIEVGRWYCLERHLRLNAADPLAADGLEELWVDGELAIRRDGLRFRRAPGLRITVFELEVYYHGLPEKYTPDKPISVSFDNVVIATERIGCLNPGWP
jgi:hypothetical protein